MNGQHVERALNEKIFTGRNTMSFEVKETALLERGHDFICRLLLFSWGFCSPEFRKVNYRNVKGSWIPRGCSKCSSAGKGQAVDGEGPKIQHGHRKELEDLGLHRTK